MKNRDYFIRTLIMSTLGSLGLFVLGLIIPVLFAMILPFPGLYNVYYLGFTVIPAVLLLGGWILFAKLQVDIPSNPFARFLPLLIPYVAGMGCWIVGASLYDTGLTRFIGGSFIEETAFIPIGLTAGLLISGITVTVVFTLRGEKLSNRWGVAVIALVPLLLGAFSGYLVAEKKANVLSRDISVQTVSDEVNLSLYSPFSTVISHKLLDAIDGEPAARILPNHPRLDGATALYPVYSAVATALYKDYETWRADSDIRCSKTSEAYNRLIRGETDIIFVAQPSKEQLAAAEAAGVTLTLTPIGREAFVFLTHRDNPVSTLTVGQIRDIYTKKIKNWRDVGGNNERILAFQRPAGSGSQTAMIESVMKETPLSAPLQEEYIDDMIGVVREVADYRNYTSSIGYSFRFFATGMSPNENIKLLAVNSIEPTADNIRGGTYPFTVDVYAVTAGPPEGNERILIDWLLTEQGQSLIEKCGYVGLS